MFCQALTTETENKTFQNSTLWCH